MPAQRLPGTRLYLTLVRLGVPLRWWCRLEVRGGDVLPPAGTGTLLVANHDSWLDPLALADTLMRAGRPLRFLATGTLWRRPRLGRLLEALRQIPVHRGAGDAALDAAVRALGDGEAICVFPEGGLSRGRRLRAHRGVARLVRAAPDALVILAAVRGGTDLIRFPTRPRVDVELFLPAGGAARPGEDPADLAARLLDEIRERVPPAPCGRRHHAPRRPADRAVPAGVRPRARRRR